MFQKMNKIRISLFVIGSITAVLLSLLLIPSTTHENSVLSPCSPDFWENHLELWKTVGVDYNDYFDKTFGTDYFDPDITLKEAISKKGMGLNHLARSSTAAYLNALRDPEIDETALRTGVIIGRAEIYDVKVYNSVSELKSDYKKHFATEEFLRHKYGFLLKKPKELRRPIPYKGSLGFFNVHLDTKVKENDIKSELFDEEHRYQWIGRH